MHRREGMDMGKRQQEVKFKSFLEFSKPRDTVAYLERKYKQALNFL